MRKSADSAIQYLKGIGPYRAKILSKVGIHTIEDLFYYFPRRYEDRTRFSPVSLVKEGLSYTIKVEVLARGRRQSSRRRGFSIVELSVGDQTGKIFCVWFNQPYLEGYFKIGTSLILYGKIERYAGRLQMNSPEFEIISQGPDESKSERDSLNMGRVVPIYTLPAGITQRYFRQVIKYALDEYLPRVNDFLPYDIRSRYNLLNLAKGLINIHFPDNSDMQKLAYERLSFEEFFLFQLPLALRKLRKKQRYGIAHKIEGNLVKNFMENLPFKLTLSQEKVIGEIKRDMAKSEAMQRLLQGDVGSGKTVVATIATIFAIQGGYQVAFMVPTEILARQHFDKISSQFSVLSSQKAKIKVGLLASSLSRNERDKTYQDIKEGAIDLVIGTHALLEEGVIFKNLGLAVIDEQHKFGVAQRALLPQKGFNPDILIMTATPIPRTLAITLYGDLDISIISELPPGHQPIKTVYFTIEQRSEAYAMARAQLRQGYQVYIVYPIIEESFALDIAGAEKMFNYLKTTEFKEFSVGLIHGKLKQKEQDEVMVKFKHKELDILVSTTIVEVGLDVPDATCMIVEQAERFGLCQLHQLRGRVGRGEYASFCILVSGAETEEAKARLEALVKYNDGFRIAEEDLKLRGPGEFFGQRQHGLTELKIANPLTQMQLLRRSRQEAIKLINQDQHLASRQNSLLREKLLQRFPGYERLMAVG